MGERRSVSAPSLAATVAAVAPPNPSPTTITSYSVCPGWVTAEVEVEVEAVDVVDVVLVVEVVEAEVLGLVAVVGVNVVEDVVVDGEGRLLSWTTRPITTMVAPNPARIIHRRGSLPFGSGPPATGKSYGERGFI